MKKKSGISVINNKALQRWLWISAAAALGVMVLLMFEAEIQAGEKEIRIGIDAMDESGASTFRVLYENLKVLEEIAQVKFEEGPEEDMGTSTEASVYSVERQIEDGMDGILICPPTDSVLPAICRMCEEAKVYWGIYFRSIQDDDIRELCEKSPYYIGNVYENEENSAYELMKKAAEEGFRKIAVISEAKWDTTCEAREKGIRRAIDELEEVEIIAEVRGMNSLEDADDCVKSLLQAYPELDGIFLVGSMVQGVQKKICSIIKDERGTGSVGLVTIDFSDTLTEDFKSGVLKAAYGLPQLSIDPYYMAIKMVNTLKGYPLSEENTSHCVEGVLIESEEQAKEMAAVIENSELLYFSEDFVRENLLKWNNPLLDEEEFQRIINENTRLENCVVKPAS